MDRVRIYNFNFLVYISNQVENKINNLKTTNVIIYIYENMYTTISEPRKPVEQKRKKGG